LFPLIAGISLGERETLQYPEFHRTGLDFLSIHGQGNRSYRLLECRPAALAARNDALQQDKFEFLIVPGQYQNSIFRALAEAPGDVVAQLRRNVTDFHQINDDVTIYRVFADQFDLVYMLAHIFAVQAQKRIVRDAGSLIHVVTQPGEEDRKSVV